MKNILFFILTSFAFSNFSFSQTHDDHPIDANFMVFSDPHYYDASLGTEGEAFQEYLNNDRKLLKESRELLEEVINIIIKESPNFVIIPGDLTKDGSKVSHLKFAELISKIEDNEIPVYVVPGNHDINNGESNSYQGEEIIPVENITPDEFKSIYKNFGYSNTIFKDTNSLSYVTEPSPGLWLLGLDACLYRENKPRHHPITDGEFSKNTIQWVEYIASEAKMQNKKLITFMHHGVLEHYQKQNKFYGEYIVNDYKKISKKFADLGINIVFTGHYHAQDIVMKKWGDDKYLIDIETGSLVTYPCPFRKITLFDNKINISSELIKSIPMIPENFPAYSRDYVHAGIAGIAEGVMEGMGLNMEDAKKLSGQIGDAFIAHYHGDEKPEAKYLDLSGVGLFGRLIIMTKKRLIKELYCDLSPADNEITIDLSNGEIIAL